MGRVHADDDSSLPPLRRQFFSITSVVFERQAGWARGPGRALVARTFTTALRRSSSSFASFAALPQYRHQSSTFAANDADEEDLRMITSIMRRSSSHRLRSSRCDRHQSSTSIICCRHREGERGSGRGREKESERHGGRTGWREGGSKGGREGGARACFSDWFSTASIVRPAVRGSRGREGTAGRRAKDVVDSTKAARLSKHSRALEAAFCGVSSSASFIAREPRGGGNGGPSCEGLQYEIQFG